MGGLSVGSLFSKNLNLLSKWKWRFLTEKEALWCLVIKEFYGGDGGFSSPLDSFGEKDEKVIAIFKTPRKNHYASDSYDDFVKSPRQPILIRSKRKVREKKNESKKRQKIDNVSHSSKKYGKKGKTYPPVNRRHPPKCLIDSIKKFTDSQRERVKTMGFEHVLSIKIEKIPKKLGYWIVTNYDLETSSLNINGRSLLITKEVIHDVYGVPIGEVPIKGFKKSRKRDNVIEEWKRQFVIKNGRVIRLFMEGFKVLCGRFGIEEISW
ncbi:hypothetical protein Tco_0442587 [Tanacetum coccineum]